MLQVVTAQRVDVLTGPRSPPASATPGDVRLEGQPRPRMDQEFRRWPSLCLYPTGGPWSAWVRSVPIGGTVPLSAGTGARRIQDAVRTRGTRMPGFARVLVAHTLDHGEETGISVTGVRHGCLIQATRWVTLSCGHRHRGHTARNTSGMRPAETGRATPDRVRCDDYDACAPLVCGSQLMAEQDHQPWVRGRQDRLRRQCPIPTPGRAAGAHRVPHAPREALVLQDAEILEQGVAAHRMQAPFPPVPSPTTPGCRTHTRPRVC